MEYVTGIYALNMPCSLGTPGDWHGACCAWDNVPLRDTADSVFGDWGIESAVTPIGECVNAANHMRACLDLMEEGFSPMCQGMKNDYFDALVDDEAVFEKVVLLESSPYWEQIDSFMCKEYMLSWIDFKERRHDR